MCTKKSVPPIEKKIITKDVKFVSEVFMTNIDFSLFSDMIMSNICVQINQDTNICDQKSDEQKHLTEMRAKSNNARSPDLVCVMKHECLRFTATVFQGCLGFKIIESSPSSQEQCGNYDSSVSKSD